MQKQFALLAAASLAALTASRNAVATVDGVINGSDSYTTTVYQNQGTGFGDNQSELDGAFLKYTPGGAFELGLTGNLETNNTFVLFIDSKAGGAVNAAVPGGFNNMSHNGANSGFRTGGWDNATLAPAFNPDWSMEFYRDASGYYFDLIDLQEPAGSPNRNRYQGHFDAGTVNTVNYLRDGEGSSTRNITLTLNDTNTLGVGGSDGTTGVGGNTGAETATTGWEFSFNADFLGHTAGNAVRAMAMIHGGDSYLSNQFLPGVGYPTGNLAYNKFNAQTFGDQSYLDAFTPTNTTAGLSLWDTPSNWTGTATPSGAEHSALLAGTSAQTVDIGFGVTLGYLKFANPAGVTIDGSAALSMDGGSGAAIIISAAGDNYINPTPDFPDDTRVRVDTDSGLTFTNGFTTPANQRITKAGAGTLTINGPFSMPVGASLAIDAGIVHINASPSGATGDVYVGGVGFGAQVNFNAAGTYNALALNGQGVANIDAPITLKNLYVNGGTGVGSGSITIDDAGAGGAQIYSDPDRGDGHVNTAVNVASNANAGINGGSTAFVDGAFSIAAGKTLTKTLPGWFVITGPQSHGVGAVLDVTDGTLKHNSNAGTNVNLGPDTFPNSFDEIPAVANLTVNVTGGRYEANADQILKSLNITPNRSPSNGGTGTGGTRVQIDTNRRIRVYDNGTNDALDPSRATAEALWAGAQAGYYDDVNWNAGDGSGSIGGGEFGNGIFLNGVASTSINGLGLALVGDGNSFENTLEMREMVLGDANGDDAVDGSDAGTFASYFGNAPAGFGFSYYTWMEGDFNGDLAVDGADAGIFASSFGSTFNPANGPSSVSAVPEPASSLGALGFAALATLRRRRRV